MSVVWFRIQNEVITLTLHVQPGAKRTEVVGLHGAALKVKLAAPPVEGKANDALMRYLADYFAVPLRQVELKQGGQSRHKVIAISGSSIDPLTLLPQ
jgi:uncharacterized protein (TIGR00251 family)